MTSLYATIAPHFTQDLLTPELKVGYCDESGSWPFVAASLSQRLPLRCIEWKNLVGATKFIDKLPLNFVAQNSLEALPLVCVYLVKCEDMEFYKATVKQRLGAWIEKMNAAKVEWMVLYVPLGTRAKGSASRNANNSVYKKIFDKIRADFAHKRPSATSIMIGAGSSANASSSSSLSSSSATGTSHSSERICKIEILEGNSIVGAAPGQHQQHESQWSELLLRLRHCIMDAFQTKCYQYEEEVRVLDTKLDELDAIFMNLNEKGSFQDDSKVSFASDDSIFTTAPPSISEPPPLETRLALLLFVTPQQLALDLPSTQQQIASNRASARVIQLHCFCRQIRTLYLMGNFPQLIQRATTFIGSFFQNLKTLSETTADSCIERHLPYQWAVGACLEIAYACELSWNGHDYQVSSASVPTQATQAITPEVMARHLGDILYLARRTLKAFARSSGSGRVAASSYDVTSSLDDSLSTDPSEPNSTAWYEWLQRMFASPIGEHFERCVWEMSHLASLHFSRAGRHRFAVFLGGECARYHFRHREFESASRLFRSHSRQCEEDKWWNLVGDCVRNICSSELKLGRAAEAVAVCFSMLGITQEAKAEIGREYLEKMMHTLVQSLDEKESAAKMKMGELIKPSVSLETMQTAGIDLDHGEVRVTVCVTNRFPAGIHIEQLHVRFARRTASTSEKIPHLSIAEDKASQRTSSRSSSALDSSCEPPRLHSLVLEDTDTARESSEQDTNTEQSGKPRDGVALATADACTNPNEASRGDSLSEYPSEPLLDSIDITVCEEREPHNDDESTGEAGSPVDRQSLDPIDDGKDVLVLEESNVYLYEKASVNLVFLHGGLDVGHYVCTGVDCVLAGNTFTLLSASELAQVAFEIPRRESTLRIVVEGPPLLTPQSLERICIKVDAQRDTVVDGVLEIAAMGDVDALRFLTAELQSNPPSPIRKLDADSIEGKEKLSLRIPPLSPGDTLTYSVWLIVDDVDPEETCTFSTVSASLRYQHVTATETNIAVRRAEAAFQILYPLVERIRLKRVDSRVFVAISLTCNSECGVTLRDYRLAFQDDEERSSSNAAATLTIAQDPNGRIRNTKLRPDETVHLAFTLRCPSSGIDVTDEVQLYLDLRYESGVYGVGGRASDLQQLATATPPECWESTSVVRVCFDAIKGKRYRIDVDPKVTTKNNEFVVGEEIIFHVVVREFGATQKLVARPAGGQDADDSQVLLCLDESSERDWILVGKQQERFRLRWSNEDINGTSVQQSERGGERSFATQKRLISTRVGRLRFPTFHLRIIGDGREEDRASSERVLYPQSAMQVIVT